MNPKFRIVVLCLGLFILGITACKKTTKEYPATAIRKTDTVQKKVKKEAGPQRIRVTNFQQKLAELQWLPDTSFVRLADYSPNFSFDLRYATNNNFLKEKVYDCGECYTRVKTAKALIAANAAFLKMGYRIHFFDCYRPNSVQHKMWEIFPNPQYVANPFKGSIHNRGGAVDISLVDDKGELLDMGTDFDFFGHKAHHDYLDLPPSVLKNRKLLKETLAGFGFNSIRTEWWHYNLSGTTSYPISDFVWGCE